MARDLVVYGEPTLERALRSVGQLWHAHSGTRVNVFVAPSDLSYLQIDRGARCDVIFALAGPVTAAAISRKSVDAATVRRILRNDLVLVGPRESGPPITTPAALSQFISGKRVAISNPDRDVAGAYAATILRGVGISVDENANVVVAESSAGVVDILASGKARIGIIYATDAAPPPGYAFACLLAEFRHPPIEYVVAVAAPQSDIRPFMTFIRAPQVQAAFAAAGLAAIDE